MCWDQRPIAKEIRTDPGGSHDVGMKREGGAVWSEEKLGSEEVEAV